MNNVTNNSVINPEVNIAAVQEMVAQTVKQLSVDMVQALIAGHSEKLNFKQLADKHISRNLNEQLDSSDEKTKLVYEKLFTATKKHIERFSPPLVQTLTMIDFQTNNAEDSILFLGSFVLPAARTLIENLKSTPPEVLENINIWQ